MFFEHAFCSYVVYCSLYKYKELYTIGGKNVDILAAKKNRISIETFIKAIRMIVIAAAAAIIIGFIFKW